MFKSYCVFSLSTNTRFRIAVTRSLFSPYFPFVTPYPPTNSLKLQECSVYASGYKRVIPKLMGRLRFGTSGPAWRASTSEPPGERPARRQANKRVPRDLTPTNAASQLDDEQHDHGCKDQKKKKNSSMDERNPFHVSEVRPSGDQEGSRYSPASLKK